jgi:calcium-dependent protein kinase
VFNNNYDEKCDIWSAGVILYIMLCGSPPFKGIKDKDIKNKILKGEYSFQRSYLFLFRKGMENSLG